jgi:hypothetical protein
MRPRSRPTWMESANARLLALGQVSADIEDTLDKLATMARTPHRAYTAPDPRVRRLMNQAFFTKLHISDEHIVGSDLAELFASPSSSATTHHPRRSRPRMGGIRLQARARSGQFVRLDVPSTRGCESAMNGRWTSSGLRPPVSSVSASCRRATRASRSELTSRRTATARLVPRPEREPPRNPHQ